MPTKAPLTNLERDKYPNRLNWHASEEDHKKLKVLAAQWGLTLSEAVSKLVNDAMPDKD